MENLNNIEPIKEVTKNKFERETDFYLLGDISICPDEELLYVYKNNHIFQKDARHRVEGELLSRKLLNIKEDFF